MFIHLLVDEHLECFHLLALANNAAVNISVQVSDLLLSVFLGGGI